MRGLQATLMLAAGLWLAGCSTADDVVFTALAGEAPGEKGTIPPNVAAGSVGSGPPALGRTIFRKAQKIGRRPKAQPPLPSSATAASLARRHRALKAKLFQHDDELQRTRRSIRLHHKAYAKAIGGFGLAKKRTLPENDAAYAINMRDARARLGRLNGDLLKLNAVASKVNVSAARTTQTLTDIRAATAKARSAQEKRELTALEGALGTTNGLARKMLAEIHLDIGRQSAYAQDQNRGLDTLHAEVLKDSGRNRGSAQTGRVGAFDRPTLFGSGTDARRSAGAGAGPGEPVPRSRSAKPLVRIRFTKPDVAYKAALYRALQAALKKRPDISFEVVGVAPNNGRRQGAFTRAQSVMFSMADMGVPPDRVTVTSEAGGSGEHDEVRIFVR